MRLVASATDQRSLSTKMPATIPVWMEYVNGTNVKVTNAGRADLKVFHSMSLAGAIMNAPMKTMGTAVAAMGMAVMMGARKVVNKKNRATTIGMSPVLAPSTMPAQLSAEMMAGLVPSKAPTIVDRPALTKLAFLLRAGIAPSSRRPATLMSPCCTPAKSKMATSKKMRLPRAIVPSFPLPGAHPSKLKAKTVSTSGNEATPLGASERPPAHATMDMLHIPTRISPGTMPATNRAAITQNPKKAKYRPVLEGDKLPKVTNEAGEATTKPMAWKPMSAWNTPMATVIACFKWSDKSEETMKSQTPIRAKTTNRAPATKQQLNASCHVAPADWQRVKAKYELRPMPGMMANGTRPSKPTQTLPKAEVNVVAVRTDAAGMLPPGEVALAKMVGFTVMM
mmetsp:Transcript_41482/g.120105  ORF Transcript_41482/g.120105 Transcript_41482/m.120105 type:complete len:395 (-) Transcript_41482:489-1673(-)